MPIEMEIHYVEKKKSGWEMIGDFLFYLFFWPIVLLLKASIALELYAWFVQPYFAVPKITMLHAAALIFMVNFVRKPLADYYSGEGFTKLTNTEQVVQVISRCLFVYGVGWLLHYGLVNIR